MIYSQDENEVGDEAPVEAPAEDERDEDAVSDTEE